MIRYLFSFFFLFFLSPLYSLSFPNIQSPEQITELFPRSIDEHVTKREQVNLEIEAILTSLREMPNSQISFENLLIPFNEALAYIKMHSAQCEAQTNVEPSAPLRKEAETSYLFYQQFYSKIFAQEDQIYQKMKLFYQTHQETLSKDQDFLITYFLQEFEANGQSQSLEKRKEIQQLTSEIALLEKQFSCNIQEDQSQLVVYSEALSGIDQQVLQRLDQNEAGQFTLKCDYPSYFSIMTACENAQTRKDFLTLFMQRAYPNNQHVLNQLIEKRDQLAKALDFESYNDFVISKEMAKNPQNVSHFLNQLHQLSLEKREREFEEKLKHLPQGIHTSKTGKIYPWDASYIQTQYKKKFFDIDQEKIAEYFPLMQTFDGLLTIYESFFDIQIRRVPTPSLWHEDLQTLEISEKDGQLIGYVVLDLFPRPNKYSHACCVPGVAWNYQQGPNSIPGVNVIIANFTKPTKNTPSLLKHIEVTTLFHEFGHALHDLFAKHSYPFLSTIATPAVKYDYVELPSQLLENWLWQPDILATLSAHYQTGEPLPQENIEKLIQAKNISSAEAINGQVFLSFLALQLFSEGAHKDVKHISKELKERFSPHYEVLEEDYFFLSFGHLTEYGPRYYGYLWSDVYASDIFEQIHKEGLLNPTIGKRYRAEILNPGASRDPNELLLNFLRRPTSINPYLKKQGLQ